MLWLHETKTITQFEVSPPLFLVHYKDREGRINSIITLQKLSLWLLKSRPCEVGDHTSIHGDIS